ncbi:hypothetical protein [Chondrinema litorale]|uniref:hypothetical protein n=1 Tax=Chondrinema litorale TaxID=2994555 RepID=UPI00254276A5|nr:hypothetical protein [Chondrinema litorale]UZR95056.1 hypothetical protein OQ292_04405 [Chondrinema litorale]
MAYIKRFFKELSQLTGQDTEVAEPVFSTSEVDFFFKKTGLIIASIAIATAILLFAFA